jgi:hypothetical protein
MGRLLERAVPRYTPYPTTPHFTSAVGATTHMSWLATLSLYLHVPYWAQLCFYCGCHTKATLRRDPVDAYAQRLIEEIALLGRYVGRRKVVHIHWGGGTPSILGTDWLDRIAGALSNSLALGEKREHAVELDPRRLNLDLMYGCRSNGSGTSNTPSRWPTAFSRNVSRCSAMRMCPGSSRSQRLINERDLPPGPERLEQAQARRVARARLPADRPRRLRAGGRRHGARRVIETTTP